MPLGIYVFINILIHVLVVNFLNKSWGFFTNFHICMDTCEEF